MAAYLQMSFIAGDGKSYTFRVQNIRENLTQQEINTAMDTIIAQNVFVRDGLPLLTKKAAQIVDRQVTEFEV